MDEYDCPRMVYSSSATVYGTPPEIPIPETTRLKADSPYGKTKVMCETILEDLCGGALCPFPSENSPAQATQFFFTTANTDRWRAMSLRYFKSVPTFLRNDLWTNLSRSLVALLAHTPRVSSARSPKVDLATSSLFSRTWLPGASKKTP